MNKDKEANEVVLAIALHAIKDLSGLIGCDIVPRVRSVNYKDPFTLVNWSDGTETLVKAYNEPFDKEKGLAMAYMRKIYSSRNEFKRQIEGAFDEIKFMEAVNKAISQTKPEPSVKMTKPEIKELPRVGSYSLEGQEEDRRILIEQLRKYAVKHLGIPDIDITNVHLRYCINGNKGITGIEFTLDVFGDERN